MKSIEGVNKASLRDLLAKGWLTHDGAWFLSVAQDLGIDAANRLNKAAIRGQAPFEVKRILRTVEAEPIDSFKRVRELLLSAMELILPESVFSKFTLEVPGPNVLRWSWQPGGCFAFKGISAIGMIDGYECGVIYRILCWFEALGIPCRAEPELDKCVMRQTGACSGSFVFDFPNGEAA